MIVVVGLAFEARIAAQSGLSVICAGSGRNLAGALSEAIGSGCEGLISFGVAGGLRADLPPGTCIVGSSIVAGDRRFSTDDDWSKNLLQCLPSAQSGALAGVGAPVMTADAKRALHSLTGALAVDMEFHIVADTAAQHGLPMAAFGSFATRPLVVCRKCVPRRARGRHHECRHIASINRSSTNHIPAMIRVALDARAARATLSRCSRLLGPTDVRSNAGYSIESTLGA